MAGHVNSLHEQVAQQLRDLIFSGALSPGAFVDESRLCDQLTISRTPLREALKVLSAEGLIRHEPRRGCFVNEVTEQDLDDIFPVIALLEGRCAYEAALQASDADILALVGLHQQLEDSASQGRIPDYYAANFAIHEAIIAIAGNKWLAQVIGDLRKILKLARLQQTYGQRPTVSVFYQISDSPLMTIGGKQIISNALSLCGGRNIFANLTPMAPVITPEAVLAANPEAIMTSGMEQINPQALDMWKKWPKLLATQRQNFFLIDSDLVNRNGPRIIEGTQQLCTAIQTARDRRPPAKP